MLTATKVLTSAVRPSEINHIALSHDGKHCFIESLFDEMYSMEYWTFPDGSGIALPLTYYVENDEYQSHLDVATVFDC